MDKQKERQEKIILGGKSIMISDTSGRTAGFQSANGSSILP